MLCGGRRPDHRRAGLLRGLIVGQSVAETAGIGRVRTSGPEGCNDRSPSVVAAERSTDAPWSPKLRPADTPAQGPRGVLSYQSGHVAASCPIAVPMLAATCDHRSHRSPDRFDTWAAISVHLG